MCKFFALAEEPFASLVVAEIVNFIPKAFHSLLVEMVVKQVVKARILVVELAKLKLLEH